MHPKVSSQVIDSSISQFFTKQNLFEQSNHQSQFKIFKEFLQQQYNNGRPIKKQQEFERIFKQVYLIKLPNLRIGFLTLVMCFRGPKFLDDMKQFDNKKSYKGKRAQDIKYLKVLLQNLIYNPIRNPIEDIRQNFTKMFKQIQICYQAVFNNYSQDQSKQILYRYLLNRQNDNQTHQSVKKLGIYLIDKSFKQKQTLRTVEKIKQKIKDHQICEQKRYTTIYFYPLDESQGVNSSWLICTQTIQPQIQSVLKTEDWFRKQNFIKSQKSIIFQQVENQYKPKSIIGQQTNTKYEEKDSDKKRKEKYNMNKNSRKIDDTRDTVNKGSNLQQISSQKQPRQNSDNKKQQNYSIANFLKPMWKQIKSNWFQILLIAVIGGLIFYNNPQIKTQAREMAQHTNF